MKLKNQAAQIVVITLIAILTAGLVYGATDSTRTTFEGIYKIYANAMKDRDAKTIISYETDDFTIKTADGKTLNREQANAMLEQSLAILKTVSKIDQQITDIKVENDTATLMTTEKMTATTIADPTGKQHEIDSTSKSRDIWVKKGDKWMIKSSEMLEETTTMDGKPVK